MIAEEWAAQWHAAGARLHATSPVLFEQLYALLAPAQDAAVDGELADVLAVLDSEIGADPESGRELVDIVEVAIEQMECADIRALVAGGMPALSPHAREVLALACRSRPRHVRPLK